MRQPSKKPQKSTFDKKCQSGLPHTEVQTNHVDGLILTSLSLIEKFLLAPFSDTWRNPILALFTDKRVTFVCTVRRAMTPYSKKNTAIMCREASLFPSCISQSVPVLECRNPCSLYYLYIHNITQPLPIIVMQVSYKYLYIIGASVDGIRGYDIVQHHSATTCDTTFQKIPDKSSQGPGPPGWWGATKSCYLRFDTICKSQEQCIPRPNQRTCSQQKWHYNLGRAHFPIPNSPHGSGDSCYLLMSSASTLTSALSPNNDTINMIFVEFF